MITYKFTLCQHYKDTKKYANFYVLQHISVNFPEKYLAE